VIQNGQPTWVDFDYPQVVDVPIQFPSGGGWSITFPLKPGDEGTVEFQSRCIDKWWLPPNGATPGAPQPQAEVRFHDWNDAIFKPGARSKPRWLQGVSSDNVQLRSDDGKSYIELTSAGGGAANFVFPGGVTINAPTVHVVGGALQVDQDVKAGADVVAGSSTSSVGLTWTQTGMARDGAVPVAGILNVVSAAATNVKAVGDNFSIQGAISLAENTIPGGSALINQVHQVVSIINSQNFTAALSALPGQIGVIAGNPIVSAAVRLLTHDHHGVTSGPSISQQPVTET
jgi:hypothetical protein